MVVHEGLRLARNLESTRFVCERLVQAIVDLDECRLENKQQEEEESSDRGAIAFNLHTKKDLTRQVRRNGIAWLGDLEQSVKTQSVKPRGSSHRKPLTMDERMWERLRVVG
jgi:hypothetical protein